MVPMSLKRLVTLCLVLAMFVAACSSNGSSGSSDTSSTTVGETNTTDGETTTTVGEPTTMPDNNQAGLDAVNAELEGLDADARRARLIELAADEGGEVTFYTTQSVDDILPVINEFEDATDVSVNLYRAGGNTVVNRLIQEADAGYAGADLYLSDQRFIVGLDPALLLDLDMPLRDDILDFVNFSDKWVGVWINAYIAMWNTNLLSPEEAPTSWADVYSKYPGNIGVDPTDADLFMALFDNYFEPDLGMTLDETVEFFKKGLAGGYAIRGHSVGNELNMAGEFAVHGSQNLTRVVDNEAAGAPYGWLPPVQPIITRGSGAGIISSTEHPASALLLLEFILTDGQSIMAENGLAPANKTVDVAGAFSDDWEVIPLDVEKYAAEQDKWDSLWEEIVTDAGMTPG
jgi:iron(III) transport system substrate-binding protein